MLTVTSEDTCWSIRNLKFDIIKVSYTMRLLFLMFVIAVCVLFLLMDKLFFCDFDFYRLPIQSILIGGLNRLISMISIDFRYRFLSINCVWVNCWESEYVFSRTRRLKSFPWDALVYESIMAFYLNLEKLGNRKDVSCYEHRWVGYLYGLV